MTFKSAIWFPIAVGLSIINLVGVGVAMRPGQPWEHAGMHAALAVLFALWAQRLHERRGGPSGVGDRLEAFEDEVSKLRAELSETQERLDFAERLLAQRADARSVGPPR
jgi:hypothetical protein